MTFKHLKFAESSTMQAFEKLAKDKGLVVPDVVQKTAKPLLDLNPSKNFLENILKLTAGLRAQGFVRHAEDLESKYVVYKRAESLYETSKETGEDLVDQAHPKGSHTLDGGHKVLTIVDQKKEIEQVVNKKPTGKFASNQDILNAVKLVFAQDIGATEEEARKYTVDVINEAIGLLSLVIRNEDLSDLTHHDSMNGDVESNTGWLSVRTTKGHLEGLVDNLNKIIRTPINVSTATVIKSNLTAAITLINKADNISAARKLSYTNKVRDIFTRTDKLLSLLRGEKPVEAVKPDQAPAPVTEEASKKVIDSFNSLAQSIKLYVARAKSKGLKDEDPKVKWLQKAHAITLNTQKEYSSSEFKNDARISADYMEKHNSIKAKVDALATSEKWA